ALVVPLCSIDRVVMKYFFTALLMLGWNVSAADPGTLKIEPRHVMSGNFDRSVIAWSCTQLAMASVFAHEHGYLSTAIEELARTMQTGAEPNRTFKNFLETFNLRTDQDFLFNALFQAQINLEYLDKEKGPYREALKPIYTAYLSASCAQVARLSETP